MCRGRMRWQKFQYICPPQEKLQYEWADENTENEKYRYGGIKMNKLLNELLLEKERTDKNLRKIRGELKKVKKDDARIRVTYKEKKTQCYIRESSNDRMNGHYLPVSQRSRAINIVKGEYYNKLKVALEKRNKIIDKAINCLQETEPLEIYRKIGKGKQRLVESIEISNEEFRKTWEKFEYEGKTFEENAPEIYTDRGERVRSKSEKIIADKLYREGMAYRYECPLDIPYVGTFYPDFTILDEENRRNIIYEHFGLMDNEDYVNNAIAKLQQYSRQGYVLGDNLFVSMETSARPLDSRMVDRIIKQIKNK